MQMPEPDAGVLARRGEIVAALRRIVPGEGVIDSPAELRAYESDGLTAFQARLIEVKTHSSALLSAHAFMLQLDPHYVSNFPVAMDKEKFRVCHIGRYVCVCPFMYICMSACAGACAHVLCVSRTCVQY